MLVLQSETLLGRIDPQHGAEIIDLVHLPTGRQVLAHTPNATDPPRGGDLDEATWIRSYRGGWQMLAPNAGNACVVKDEAHGFHGRASNDPWTILSKDDSSATLSWSGRGIHVERRIELSNEVHVSVRMRAIDKPAPLIFVEHVALGTELLDPATQIDLPGGIACELPVDPGQSVADIPRGKDWPNAEMLDGRIEREDRIQLSEPRTRMIGVRELPRGEAAITNLGNQFRVHLEWESKLLPYLWIFHENRVTDGPWRKAAEMLIIEPASVPHAFGLAESIRAKQATWLDPGKEISYQLRVRISG